MTTQHVRHGTLAKQARKERADSRPAPPPGRQPYGLRELIKGGYVSLAEARIIIDKMEIQPPKSLINWLHKQKERPSKQATK